MKARLILGGLALALATAGPAMAQDNVKIGFITKFPVPFFATMEDAAKAYAAANPGVEIICRDRGQSYAEGGRAGAPNAIHVADRFHLLQNLVDALEQACGRHRRALHTAARGDSSGDPSSNDPRATSEPTGPYGST